MTTIYARCQTLGTLTLGFENPERELNPASYASFEFKTPESLHRIACGYDHVKRITGGIMNGENYTLAHAQEDFRLWEQWQARGEQRGNFELISPYGDNEIYKNITRREADDILCQARCCDDDYELKELKIYA